MKCYRYNIAGHLCEIDFSPSRHGEELLPSFVPFVTDEGGECLFRMKVDDCFSWEIKGDEVGQFDCGGNNFGVYRCNDGSYQFEICNERKQCCCLLQANAAFTDCVAVITAVNAPEQLFGLNNAIMLVYAFASAPYATLLVHASVVRNNEKGYLFLGRSGTGKSTHTRLWLSHIQGSDLMNDDNPVVRVVDGKTYVYGSPWSGKTPCYRNVMAPVGAFVQLQQQPENVIKRPCVLECFSYLLPSISTMKWDKRIYTANADTVTEIIKTVPVFHLGCLPDEDAARLSFRTVTQGL